MSDAREILVNPPQGGNSDIQNVVLGFIAAAHPGCAVVDLNTFPSHADRLFAFGDYPHVIMFSVQSRSQDAAMRLMGQCRVAYPQATISTLSSPIGVQCSYPFVRLPSDSIGNVHLDALPPVPDYTAFDSYPLFAERWADGTWPYALFTSFGCPMACNYCAAQRTGWRARARDHIRDEVMSMRDRVRAYTVIDDLFNASGPNVRCVCAIMREAKRQWMATNGLRADLLTVTDALDMATSGCTTVGFGIECASDAVLRAIHKGETLAKIERGIGIAKAHFASVSGYFIIGLPQSSYDLDRRSLDWAIRQGIYIHASYYTPAGSDATFYGPESRPTGRPDYPAEQQAALMQQAQGLSWGQRDVGAALRARWRMARGYGLRAAGRYCAMDLRKAWRRARR